MKTKLIKNLLALSLVLLSTTSIQAQEKPEEQRIFCHDPDCAPKIEELLFEQIEAPIPQGEKIYEVVAVEAAYPDGRSALLLDLAENFHYPQIAIQNGIEGRVVVRFVVEKDGSISNIVVTRGLGHGLDEAAIATVKKLKTFTPAYQDDKPVRSYYPIPVVCKLD